MRHAFIMAGGKGERFWPASRLAQPKHLLPVVGDRPLLTQTLDRLGDVFPPAHRWVITNREQASGVAEVCPELPPAQIVGEPVGRDTAACVGLAWVLATHAAGPAADPTLTMLPADAVIHDAEAFRAVLASACAVAEETGALVTIGVGPTMPATGYGYLEQGELLGEDFAGRPAWRVRSFREKPDAVRAAEYVASGRFAWNAGMFVWRASAIAAALQAHTPELWQALQVFRTGLAAGESLTDLMARHYPTLPKISVDYAIMEKAAKVAMLQASFDWDDVGEWPALARHLPADAAGNTVRGPAVALDSRGCVVASDGGKLVALLGCDDLIVVQVGDATLVCPKHRAQDVKKLTQELAKDPRWKGVI